MKTVMHYMNLSDCTSTVRLLGLWSCVGKGEIRHDERLLLAIDMKFSTAAAFLIGFSQRPFVWEMTGGSLRRLTPSGELAAANYRCLNNTL